MSLIRCMAAGSGFSSACFMPRNWVSSTSRRSRSLICSKVCARPPASASRRSPARGRRGRCRSAARRGSPRGTGRRRTGRGTAPPAPGRRPCRAAGVPPRGCRPSRPALAQLASLLADPAQHLVQAARAVVGAAAQQLAQRVARGRARQHVVAELVERPPHVVRRRERVGPLVPAGRTGSRAPRRVPPAQAGAVRSPYDRRRACRRLSSLVMRRLRNRPSSANSSAAAASSGVSAPSSTPSRSSDVRQAGQRADLLEQPPAGHQVAALDRPGPRRSAPSSACEVGGAEVVPERLDGRLAQQVREHLDLAALLVDLELDLARAGSAPRPAGRRRGRRPAASPVSAERRSAEAAAVSAAATPNRAETPDRASTAGDSRTWRVNRATTSSRKSGTIAASVGLLPDHADLVVEQVSG